ncbi:uncharacterized protein LOC135628690 isoform X3 [Musa acuminata AAA Group]|uniref:uncharacterized protein LOC135628690 isoform X3 n=1 Tax=Musa acuminata AAA Group TaxID=214697 RepID=UPI0031D4894C
MDKANVVEIDDPQKAPELDRDKQEAAVKLMAKGTKRLRALMFHLLEFENQRKKAVLMSYLDVLHKLILQLNFRRTFWCYSSPH